ncbi:hypothetical protein EKK58_07990 [Candidatus Dependentiae bacterium]|nr:MAG: hypothetical protein EKK58_07990 [Candidatus Dependentiae bacterium]
MTREERLAAANAVLTAKTNVAPIQGHLKGDLFQSSFSTLQGFEVGDLFGEFVGTGFQRAVEGAKDRYTLHLDVIADNGEKLTLKGSQEIWDEVNKNDFASLKGKGFKGEIKPFSDGSGKVYFAADSMAFDI